MMRPSRNGTASLSKASSGNDKPKGRRQTLNQQKKQEIKEMFESLDTDGSGNIDATELHAAVRDHDFQMTAEEIDTLIAEVDKNGNGSIDLEEFFHMMTTKIGERDSKEELMKAFQIIDKDKSGKISVKDIQQIALELGEQFTIKEVQEMVREADYDRDGEVNVDDFMKMMSRTSYGYQ